VLADHFLGRIAGIRNEAPKRLHADAVAVMQSYPWPGNVRELENAMERAIILTRGSEILPDALPKAVTEQRTQPLVSPRAPLNPTLEAIERAYIMWVLSNEHGNKSRTAEVLGIDPSTLYRKLGRYGLDT
jgi:DNA-binding NtrC family response regulator